MNEAARFLAEVASYLVITFVGAALFLAVFSHQVEPRDIGEPCREHAGVRQYVPPNLPSQVRPLKGIVICRDGKVGEVSW